MTPMNCCPRPKGKFDCHSGRFEIVVLLPNSNIHYIRYNRHILHNTCNKIGFNIEF